MCGSRSDRIADSESFTPRVLPYLPGYPKDIAVLETSFWNRQVNRSKAELEQALEDAERRRKEMLVSPPPPPPTPFDWKSFPWVEDPDKDLPDSRVEQDERVVGVC